MEGDAQAYAELLRRHQEKVFGLCLSLLKDSSEAEDAAQEIFIKAFKALASFRSQSAFPTWLYRIAHNHCLDLLRAKTRHRTESWEELLEKEGERLHRLFTAEKVEEKDWDPELVERLLSKLDPEDRLILTLREVQGLSYTELAQTLEISLQAAKSRLRRARERLSKFSDTFGTRQTS